MKVSILTDLFPNTIKAKMTKAHPNKKKSHKKGYKSVTKEIKGRRFCAVENESIKKYFKSLDQSKETPMKSNEIAMPTDKFVESQEVTPILILFRLKNQ